jgi:hypothetical protein
MSASSRRGRKEYPVEGEKKRYVCRFLPPLWGKVRMGGNENNQSQRVKKEPHRS